MSAAVGQSTSVVTATNVASQTTPSVTTQVAGSTFVIGAIGNAANGSSVVYTPSDSNTNPYTAIDTTQLYGTASFAQMQWWYSQNGVGGAGHTFTVGASPSDGFLLFALEITAGLTSGILDTHNKNADAASPFTSPGITTTQNDCILLSMLGGDSGSNPATHAESTGFTVIANCNQTNGASFFTGCIAYRNVVSIGTYNSSFTESGGSSCGVLIAAFKSLVAANGAPISWTRA